MRLSGPARPAREPIPIVGGGGVTTRTGSATRHGEPCVGPCGSGDEHDRGEAGPGKVDLGADGGVSCGVSAKVAGADVGNSGGVSGTDRLAADQGAEVGERVSAL